MIWRVFFSGPLFLLKIKELCAATVLLVENTANCECNCESEADVPNINLNELVHLVEEYLHDLRGHGCCRMICG